MKFPLMLSMAMGLCLWPGLVGAGDEPAGPTIAQLLHRLEAMADHASTERAAIEAVLDAGLKRADVQDAALADELKALDRPRPEDRALLRARRCRVAFERGELYRRAGEALAADAPERELYLQRAIEQFRTLRVEYRDVPVGQLGYIGESRARRALGQAAQATAALQPLLSAATPRDKSAIPEPTRRLAMLEQLEATLMESPAVAAVEAQTAAAQPEFRRDAQSAAHLEWIRARAMAALATQPQALAQTIAHAAAALRSETVTAVAPPYERLRRLAGLGPPVAMSVQEQLQWAEQLLAKGRPAEALSALDSAAERNGDALSGWHWMSYGRLLSDRGAHVAAADRFDRAFRGDELDAAGRIEALCRRAAALVSAAAQETDSELLDRARAALLDVVHAPAPDEARRRALQQWVALSNRADPAEVHRTLGPHVQMIGSDLFLRYALVRAQWQILPADNAGEAQRLLGEMGRIADEAHDAGDRRLSAHATLLLALAQASAPLRLVRESLSGLESSWTLLASEPETRPRAVALRVRLLVELGLIDAARKLALDPENLGAIPSALRIELAESLADRYAPESPDEALRRQVIELIQAVDDSTEAAAADTVAARRAVKALLRVEAYADAQKLIGRTPADANDSEAVMLEVAARRGRGDTDGAIRQLEAALVADRTSPVLWLALGRLRTSLGQHSAALDAHRQARAIAAPGGETWWEATIAVAESLEGSGQVDDARDVIRVAAALYPAPARPTLRARVEAVQRSLQDSIPGRSNSP